MSSSTATLTLEIKVDKKQCYDDLLEINEHISELCILIPEHMHYKAREHTDKLSKLLQGLVKSDPPLEDLK